MPIGGNAGTSVVNREEAIIAVEFGIHNYFVIIEDSKRADDASGALRMRMNFG
jgi:hypothetical protein